MDDGISLLDCCMVKVCAGSESHFDPCASATVFICGLDGGDQQQCSRTDGSVAEIHNRFRQNDSKRVQIKRNGRRETLEIEFGTYFARKSRRWRALRNRAESEFGVQLRSLKTVIRV